MARKFETAVCCGCSTFLSIRDALEAGARPRPTACPSPATHAILAQLKAGETVYQAGELPKTLRVPKIDYEPPKTVCKTPFASIFPPSMENGDGTRSSTSAAWRARPRRLSARASSAASPGMTRRASGSALGVASPCSSRRARALGVNYYSR